MNHNEHAKAAAEALSEAMRHLEQAEMHARNAGMNVTCEVVQAARNKALTAHVHAVAWAVPMPQ